MQDNVEGFKKFQKCGDRKVKTWTSAVLTQRHYDSVQLQEEKRFSGFYLHASIQGAVNYLNFGRFVGICGASEPPAESSCVPQAEEKEKLDRNR